MNRTRTLVTIVGILLSTALITVVACIATSFQQSLINMEITRSGNYDLKLYGDYTKEEVDKLNANRNIANTYYRQKVGIGKFDSKSKFKPYVCIEGCNKSAFEKCFTAELKEGRLPEKSDEIVLSPSFDNHSKISYKPGDKITFEIGVRKSAEPMEYIDENNKPQSEYQYFSQSEEYYFENETFIPNSTKTYTVVGIFSNLSNELQSYDNSACVSAYTLAEPSAKSVPHMDDNIIYADIEESAEKDYIQVTAEIFGTDPKNVEADSNGQLDDEGYEELMSDIKKSGYDISSYDFNHDLLAYKGYALSDKNNSIVWGLICLVVGVIMISSIFIIRNSFAISITEKTKLYGMLSSIGATPSQIRKNVLYEGFILGLLGIPLGILLGIGAAALLIFLCNYILIELLNGNIFVLKISFLSIAISVVLGSVTIFFSTLFSAVRASHIAPIEAIRSSNDINIKNTNKAKSYRTPKLIKKLFGTGGSIAWKNLKRSRKKYRTTVISIVVSVAVFISVYSFVQYGIEYSKNYTFEVDYNMSVFFSHVQSDNEAEYKNRIEAFEKIADSDDVTDYLLYESCWHYNFTVKSDDISKQLQGNPNIDVVDFDGSNASYQPSIVALDDISYKKVLKMVGKSYEEMKDKAVLINLTVIQDDNGSQNKIEKLFNDPVGIQLDGTNTYDEENEAQYSKLSLTVGAEITDENDAMRIYKWGLEPGSLIVSRDWYNAHISYKNSNERFSLNSSNPDKTEQLITDMNIQNMYVMNYDKEARQMRSVILILQIFVYGFIIVISLIGLTNIFNTITTNIQLRRKEFAMLRSVGMTNKEFKRMVNLESVFYTVKALCIGIPLGIAGSILTYYVFATNADDTSYLFPLLPIVISIIAVLVVVWIIMRFSINKIKNQNIIETIRNDNI